MDRAPRVRPPTSIEPSSFLPHALASLQRCEAHTIEKPTNPLTHPNHRSTNPRTGRPLRDRRLIDNTCLRSLIAACVQSLPAVAAAAQIEPAAAQSRATVLQLAEPPEEQHHDIN